MAEHAGKPKVRFAGFTEAWEQRKLGELLAESKIKGHSGNVAKKLTIKLWGKGVVEKKDFGGSVYTQYYIRKYEQFIYSKLDFLNSAFAVIPKNMDGYESTSDLPAFDCVNSNPYFIFYRVTQKDFYLKNGSIADGSRKAKRIHVDTFLGMGINAPKILEQDKIVEFFQVLDRLITLHQCNCNMATRPCEWSSGLRAIAWEQRKLGEIADIVGGGTPSTNNPSYWNGDIDWYAPAEIGEQIFLTGSQKKITVLGLQKSSATILPVGSVLFTSRAGIGNTAILAKQGATNQGFQSIVPDSQITDSYFIFSRTHELKKYAEIVGAGSTFTEVSGKQMARMPILMPKIDEQVCIGTFFRNLDRLITLHQRKRGRLENIKKAMLEKMFPKNGADVPEVRFAGFTEAWEQRKLGELLAESKIKGHSGNVAKKLTIKLWGKGVVEKKDFGGSVYTQYYIRKYEQFIYSKLDFLNSAFAVIPKNMDGYESTSDLPAFDCVNSNPYFIFYRVTQKDFYLKNGSIADGSRKAKRIHVDTFLGMGINAPKILEQDKIVEFFQVLDRLITLHQRKVALLQNIKKACLEKMFV